MTKMKKKSRRTLTPFYIQLAQLAEDKKDIKSEDIATYMKFLLSKLEGLDATPDGMDKGADLGLQVQPKFDSVVLDGDASTNAFVEKVPRGHLHCQGGCDTK